jgi:cytochrome P450
LANILSLVCHRECDIQSILPPIGASIPRTTNLGGISVAIYICSGERKPGETRAHAAPNEEVDNIITTIDAKFHARVRGLLSNSFTEDSLRLQYPVIQSHADTLVAQLKRIALSSPESTVNITDWLNFFTMDVIGDLCFGHPFGCLARGEYHDWVRTLFMYLKFMSLAAVPRYYPWLQWTLEWLMPKSIMKGVMKHQAYAYEQINKRLDSNTSRPDFMTAFLKKNGNFETMSRKEILATFNFVIVGGSETSATVLTGLFSHISRDEQIRRRLSNEIRERFKTEDDLDIDTIEELPYLEAVLQEGLRVCNPVPCGLPRVVPPGGDTYCGHFLPAGVSYFWLIKISMKWKLTRQ